MSFDVKAQIQAANDMLEIIQEQRNANANQVVQLGGQLKSAQRRLAEMEAKIADLENKIGESKEPQLPLSNMQEANGHDTSALA